MSSDKSLFISDCSSLAEKNNKRKKISYGWFDIAIAWIFGVGFSFGDTIGDVYSTVQLYYITKSENNQSDAIDNGSNTTCHQDVTLDGKSPTLRFCLSISFLVISLLYISCKSIVTYWREEKEKLTCFKPLRLESLWIALRWLCHFPPFFAAPAARTVDLIELRKKCHDESEKFFDEQVKPREQELTNILHQENSFESGPQLWLKMHMLCLHLNSGKSLCLISFLVEI